MSNRGYSMRLNQLNNAAYVEDPRHLGVLLGRFCIDNNVSVIQVAKDFGVTRQCVYNWFTGKTRPRAETAVLIKDRMLETTE